MCHNGPGKVADNVLNAKKKGKPRTFEAFPVLYQPT